jgi:Xaa-Pro aminopeptidase
MRCGVLALAALIFAGMVISAPPLLGQEPAEVSSREYVKRRANVCAALSHGLLLVPSRFDLKAENEHGFRQNADFYYLSGLGNTLRAILVLDCPAQRSFLFVAPLTGPVARWSLAPGAGPNDTLALERILPWDSFPGYLDRRLQERPGLPIYLTGEVAAKTPSGIPPLHDPAALWTSALQGRWHNLDLRSARGVLDSLRWIKSGAEIAVLRRVAALSAEALRTTFHTVAPGARQRTIEAAVVGKCIGGGGEGPSFWPWTMAGPNSVIPETFASFADYHHLDRRLESGELIRLDVGCDLGHYKGDVGRTAPVSGRFSAGQREVWQLLVAAYLAGLSRIRAGTSSEEIIIASRNRVRDLKPGIRTSLGGKAVTRLLSKDGMDDWQLHGVGLESAESGARPDTLRAGMVLAFEPGLVVDGEAFYLEDMVLVLEHGKEVLTPGLPYTADEIERAMRVP